MFWDRFKNFRNLGRARIFSYPGTALKQHCVLGQVLKQNHVWRQVKTLLKIWDMFKDTLTILFLAQMTI